MSTSNKKILYAASTASHLERFHKPYLNALAKEATVLTMGSGDGVNFDIPFDKHFFSLRNLRNIFKIRRILKTEAFDVLLLHTTLAAFLIRASMLGMRKRPYVLNVVHGYLFSERPRGLKDRILLLCEKLLRKKTDEIAVMNAEDLRIAQNHRLCCGEVSFLYGMGVPIPENDFEPSIALRCRYADDNDFVCTFVGELSARKNQVFLIQCISELRKQGFPVKLLLIGEGSEELALIAEITRLGLENDVFLTGATSKVREYLSITDLYVSASRSEGLPFNIMEAMSCGLPILASDTKGQSDLLADSKMSLYPENDRDAFCKAFAELYAGEYGMHAVEYPNLANYSLEAVFEENMKALTKGLAGK